MLFRIIRYSGLPSLFRFYFQSRRLTVLTFHDILPETADKQFSYLKEKYKIIPLQLFIDALLNKTIDKLPKNSIVIVFDDGHRSNYEILPILKKHNIPITIFLNTGIVNTSRHYWFKFNQSKYCLENLKKIPTKEKLKFLKSLGYERRKEFQNRQSLSRKEIIEMSKWVDMQSHTVYHPCLPQCTYEEAEFEISQSKNDIERDYGFKVNAIAYPNGDYTDREIQLCKKAGYLIALTTELGYNTNKTDPYKIKRMDTNDTEDMNEFIVKSSGAYLIFKPKLFFNELLKK